MSTPPPWVIRRRRRLGDRFLSGHGVEVGALHSPLWVPPGAHVTYVDRLDHPGLREHYPELDEKELSPVDVVDDGERLLQFPDDSLDFVIANHMLEHCENLLGAMRSHLAKLRPGGCAYYAVPDKRYTFDLERPLTDFEHLRRDDAEDPDWSRWGHYLEWAWRVDKADCQEDAEERARHLMDMRYSIHFHVWDAERFREILLGAHAYLGGTFRVEALVQNDTELVAVLRKGSHSTPGPAALRPVRQPSAAWLLLRQARRTVTRALKRLRGVEP